MNKTKLIFVLTGIVITVGIFWGALFLWKNFRGAAPALQKPAQNIADLIPSTMNIGSENSNGISPAENMTGMPLKLPAGFRISIFAKNLPGARVMIFDGKGNMWVSRPNANIVSLLEIRNGEVVSQSDTLTGLNHPHGLAFDPDDPLLLYIAEENRITKIPPYTESTYQKIADLPSGGRHTTRTLLFGSDKKLYVSIGSSCDVCAESDSRRAAIFSLNRDGSNFQEFSKGLRNAVFMTLNPGTKEIWTTEMGRDFLGDNLPPDEINIIREGKNYGWPYCYGKQIHDSNFDPGNAKVNFCLTSESSVIDIPAHSAPLGLTFVTNNSWPKDYRNNLLVAHHGSWNRSVPTGYKIARYKLDQFGKYIGVEDFISGWLINDQTSLGRPAGILESPDGKIFISDDKAGVIYRVDWIGK